MTEKGSNDKLVCPACGETDISWNLGLRKLRTGEPFTEYLIHCENCRYKVNGTLEGETIFAEGNYKRNLLQELQQLLDSAKN